jgi:hypothetical protein
VLPTRLSHMHRRHCTITSPKLSRILSYQHSRRRHHMRRRRCRLTTPQCHIKPKRDHTVSRLGHQRRQWPSHRLNHPNRNRHLLQVLFVRQHHSRPVQYLSWFHRPNQCLSRPSRSRRSCQEFHQWRLARRTRWLNRPQP